MVANWGDKNIMLTVLVVVLLLPTLVVGTTSRYRIPLTLSDVMVNEAMVEGMGGAGTAPTGKNLHGKPGQGYYFQMHIGTPPQKVDILVDTGSSNFAVAAAPNEDIETYFHIEQSQSFEKIGTAVSVPYTQGNWEGYLARDVVVMPSLPDGASPVTVNIACITSSENFFINGSHWEGILGLAYKDIARPDSSVEPFFDSLTDQTGTPDVFSMMLCGTRDIGNSTDVSMGGTLVIGDPDPSLYTGPMLYAAIHREWYYEVVITDISVGDRSVHLDCKEYNFDKTIVDSGTTNFRLPQKVFDTVLPMIKQNTYETEKFIPEGFWLGTEILCWPKGQMPWFNFPNVTVSLAESGNSTFDLVVSPQQYLRAVEDEYVSDEVKDCFKFAIAPSSTGSVIGAVIMEGFYVVFDRANKRVGFAKSMCQNRYQGGTSSHVKGPFHTSSDTTDCAYKKPSSSQSALVIGAYVMAGVCGVCIIPFFIMIVQWWWRYCQRPKQDVATISSLLDTSESMDTSSR